MVFIAFKNIVATYFIRSPYWNYFFLRKYMPTKILTFFFIKQVPELVTKGKHVRLSLSLFVLSTHIFLYKQDGTISKYLKNTSMSLPVPMTSHMKRTVHHNQQILST